MSDLTDAKFNEIVEQLKDAKSPDSVIINQKLIDEYGVEQLEKIMGGKITPLPKVESERT